MEVSVLRLLHISFGVLWAGSAILMGWFVIPAVREVGPAGGAVMRGVVARRLPEISLLAGLVTVASGVRAYQLRFTAAWVTTPEGLALTLALVVGLSALAMGTFVQRPTARRLAALSGQAGPATDEAKALSTRLGRIGNALAWHATVLVVLMSGLRLFQSL